MLSLVLRDGSCVFVAMLGTPHSAAELTILILKLQIAALLAAVIVNIICLHFKLGDSHLCHATFPYVLIVFRMHLRSNRLL